MRQLNTSPRFEMATTIEPLKPWRRSLRPGPEDNLEAIAKRELPGVEMEQAIKSLYDWNPHLMRGRRDGAVLVSDVVFLEPPPKVTGQGGW
jgi:hypothetical protein